MSRVEGRKVGFSAPQNRLFNPTTTSGIRVTGTNSDDIIRVYTTDRAMQQSVRAEGSQVNIPLHKDKVYVVKIGAKTMKQGI